jgi:signal transduction histidine kinase
VELRHAVLVFLQTAEHGGWIAVRSKLGQGSTFSVFLPRGQPS